MPNFFYIFFLICRLFQLLLKASSVDYVNSNVYFIKPFKWRTVACFQTDRKTMEAPFLDKLSSASKHWMNSHHKCLFSLIVMIYIVFLPRAKHALWKPLPCVLLLYKDTNHH